MGNRCSQRARYPIYYTWVITLEIERIQPLARITDMNFGVIPGIIAVPVMFRKMQARALKLINKAVGCGVYGYEASSNIDSVMYGPIMGPDDLDRVGIWYQQ
jgi:hypothetical protein